MEKYSTLKHEVDSWYANGDYFAWDNCEIFYRRLGSGPVLLMVHGFPTAGCDWCDMAQELSKSFTIVAADIADAGHSRNPRRKTYTLHEHADMLEALVEYLDIDTVGLVGHDAGDCYTSVGKSPH